MAKVIEFSKIFKVNFFLEAKVGLLNFRKDYAKAPKDYMEKQSLQSSHLQKITFDIDGNKNLKVLNQTLKGMHNLHKNLNHMSCTHNAIK